MKRQHDDSEADRMEFYDGMRARGYRPAGAVRYGATKTRWNLGEIDMSDEGVLFSIAIHPDGDDGWVQWVDITIPLRVDVDDLVVGEAEVKHE